MDGFLLRGYPRGFYVEAFEPSKDNCNIINQTIKSNIHDDAVRLHSIALGEKSEKGILELYPNDSSRILFQKRKLEYSPT